MEKLLEEIRGPIPDPAFWEEHARQLDSLLGLRIEEIESALRQRGRVQDPSVEAWIALKPEALLTPYFEFAELVGRVDVRAEAHWVDLGCAYSRLGVVLSLLCPHSRYTGIELIEERANEGARVLSELGCQSAQVFCEDLGRCEIPQADVYFLYDFGGVEQIRRVLLCLQEIARTRRIQVIARGRFTRHEIDRHFPWLSQVVPPVHGVRSSIYRSA